MIPGLWLLSWQGRFLLLVFALLPWVAVGFPEVGMPVLAASGLTLAFVSLFLYSFVRLRRSLVAGLLVGELAVGLLYLSGTISWHPFAAVGYLALPALLCEDPRGVFE